MRPWVLAALAAFSFAAGAAAQNSGIEKGKATYVPPPPRKVCHTPQGLAIHCPPPGKHPPIPSHTQGPPTATQTIPPNEKATKPQ